MKRKEENEHLQREMLEKIMAGGAWFVTRKGHYTWIGFSKTLDCLCARECFLREAAAGTQEREAGISGLEGGAYTFGTDWFDISFHGRRIDIYADADSFRSWDVWYDPEKGTCFKAPENSRERARLVADVCREADRQALAGITEAYHIDGTNFAHLMGM